MLVGNGRLVFAAGARNKRRLKTWEAEDAAGWSGGAAIVVVQEAAQSFAGLDLARGSAGFGARFGEAVAQPLMRAFSMIMDHPLNDGVTHRLLAEEDHSVNALANRAFKTAGSMGPEFYKSKATQILQALALQYAGEAIATAAGIGSITIHIKGNGLPNSTPYLYNRGLGATGFIRLSGYYSIDRAAINRKTGHLFTPVLPIPQTRHHHEVPGVMELIPAFMNHAKLGDVAITHFGGTFYWEIAYGRKYQWAQ